jgi:1,4-dihydroxy-2-naphthoate octaprenyltransferase
LFLLPVFLFAISQARYIDPFSLIVSFFTWHFLVYPSSNGYNSYMDRDETPVGGLRSPMQPTRQLFNVSLIMDLAAIILGFLVSPWFSLGIFIYIAASRAYSYRGIRIKKYPIAGFLTVFIFQGAHVYFFSLHAVEKQPLFSSPALPAVIASLLIGALYPLTQIYQHEADKKDGVVTISYLLGKKGSFIFSMILFLLATLLMYAVFSERSQLNLFYFFLLFMFPVVSFFLYWMSRVWKNEDQADFKNSMLMSIISTACTTAYFIFLNIHEH